MVNIKTLLPELRGLVKDLAEDLLARSTADALIDAKQRGEYQKIKDGGRTAQPFEEWRDDFLDQVAVAWVLACVFVRFIEDNDLINERFLAGEGDHGKMAEGAHELYFRSHPHESDREYLEYVFREIRRIPAAAELFAEGKTPLWALAPSGDAAKRLLDFFREIDAEVGGLRRSFATKGWDTQPIVDVYEKLDPQARFLGDLYQDLSEHARKKFALLQTPGFVEEFILDRTLNLALGEFGLKGLRMIDPTCGSGHFLLGAFARLFREWMKPENGIDNPVVAAQNALDGVWGVDINPFAVAITRFRLLVAAVNACGIRKLNQQSYAWKVHLATGDSLLWGSRPGFGGDRVAMPRQGELYEADPIFAVEDPVALQEVLGQGYHVVVGNPPYITVKDRAQNDAYRERYSTCHQKYSLGVPFTQRFWELAFRKGERLQADGEHRVHESGHVGLITANSFMKRGFGKKLIEEYFTKIDLTYILDTSGAYIPGHGTPTVILFGRSRKPLGDIVRAVFGIKGEPSTPTDPSQGLVWRSIVNHIDKTNCMDEYTSTAELPRSTFTNHPWSIGGGGIADLVGTIEDNAQHQLAQAIEVIGVFGMTNCDEVFFVDASDLFRQGVEPGLIRPLLTGDDIRDWAGVSVISSIFPYDLTGKLVNIQDSPSLNKRLWSYRTILGNRATFARGTYFSENLPWWKWHQTASERLQTPLTITFAFVATHNHFALDRGGYVFNRHAPIIKLSADSNDDDHLALLGLLNSSVACFWMKQSLHDKGGGGIGGGLATEFWEHFFEFTGAGLQRFPIPEDRPLYLARLLDRLGKDFSDSLPDTVVRRSTPTLAVIEEQRAKAIRLRGRMIALQEELDWKCYYSYGLLPEDSHYDGDDLPPLALGERAFEILMARRMAEGKFSTTWFERHGANLVTQLPDRWPESYRKLVEERVRLMETSKEIGLIERPEYKRRWNDEPWHEREQRALRHWLLDRLESPSYRKGPRGGEPNLQSTAELADRASGDGEFLQVAAMYRGRPDFDVAALVRELVESESIPFLPVLIYKPTGLRKREVWERTWQLQRKQDAGEEVSDIPVPPKYTTADFLKPDYWRLRGKLDVPKERWISYPYLQTESDPSTLVIWAGWDHLQQAIAIINYYDARKREGWDGRRLSPILAGLNQLLPWISQWHPEIDPEFGDTAGQSYQILLENDAHELGLTLDDIRNWQPPQATTRRRART